MYQHVCVNMHTHVNTHAPTHMPTPYSHASAYQHTITLVYTSRPQHMSITPTATLTSAHKWSSSGAEPGALQLCLVWGQVLDLLLEGEQHECPAALWEGEGGMGRTLLQVRGLCGLGGNGSQGRGSERQTPSQSNPFAGPWAGPTMGPG